MSGGTFNQGTVAKIKVGPSDPPSVELEGVKSATLTGTRDTTKDDFYMEASDSSVGAKSMNWQIDGKCKSSAPGLILLEAAFHDNTGTPIWISGSIDGTKGRSVQVRVSNLALGFPDVNNKCTYSFQASYAGSDTALAAGTIFD